MKQEQIDKSSKRREDDPDLEFDPCQESLNGLQDLLILEAKQKAKARFEAMNRSSVNLKSSQFPLLSPEKLVFKNTFNQPIKIRDPPPGFSLNNPQNACKLPFDAGSSIINKSPLGLHSQQGFRSNLPLQRCQPTGVSLNNSFVDFSTHSRDVPDTLSPLLQQQLQSQRFLNLSPAQQFPVADPRFSGVLGLSQQNQTRPTENLFFNQSLAENRASTEFNLRMQQLRSNEFRQWQQMNGNINNFSSFSDLPQPMTSEQLAKVQQAMYKAFEASQRSNVSGLGHRLSYTKKL